MKSSNDVTKVITGKVRFSFANVWEPRSIVPGGPLQYSCMLIIPKDDTTTITHIQNAIKAALEQTFGSKIPKTWMNPLRDGDEAYPDQLIYHNSMVLNTKNSKQPGIVDAQIRPILDQSELYSGCYGRASIRAYAYDNVNKGVSFWLNNIQKLEDGPNLAGCTSPEQDFADSINEQQQAENFEDPLL